MKVAGRSWFELFERIIGLEGWSFMGATGLNNEGQCNVSN
jgi:hypothetical protein